MFTGFESAAAGGCDVRPRLFFGHGACSICAGLYSTVIGAARARFCHRYLICWELSGGERLLEGVRERVHRVETVAWVDRQRLCKNVSEAGVTAGYPVGQGACWFVQCFRRVGRCISSGGAAVPTGQLSV